MARQALGMISLARKGKDLALAQLVFENLRNRILDGLWRHGEKLPGTRVIAKDAGVSRWTAVMAVDMLLAEGLVETRKRSGTYVVWAGSGPEFKPGEAAHERPERQSAHVPFAVGVPGLDLFSVAEMFGSVKQAPHAVADCRSSLPPGARFDFSRRVGLL